MEEACNMNMKRIKELVIRFNNPIAHDEIPLFRGAIANAREDMNLLFHNHLKDGRFRYSYPLIQYKRIDQKAAIVCLEEGTDAIGQFFGACNFDVTLGDRRIKLEVESIKPYQHLVQVEDNKFAYSICHWLPLNPKNYEAYCKEESLASRYAMLERILAANIVSFVKGLGMDIDGRIVTYITQLDKPRLYPFKNVKLMSFDAEFKTNISLPNFIGLGKSVSIGNGRVETIDNNNNKFK